MYESEIKEVAEGLRSWDVKKLHEHELEYEGSTDAINYIKEAMSKRKNKKMIESFKIALMALEYHRAMYGINIKSLKERINSHDYHTEAANKVFTYHRHNLKKETLS